jgi:maltose O-acetyltransferase
MSAHFDRLNERAHVVVDRLRALWLRLRGANLGHATRIGRACIVPRAGGVSMGSRVVLEHGVYVKAIYAESRIRLGDSVFVGCLSEFDISSELWIGDQVLIAPGCFITDHGHRHAPDKLISEQGCDSGPVRIEDDAWLGAKVIVLPGVTIGKGAVVAAGAVVTRDVAPMDIVAGVPARKIGSRLEP